MHFVKLSKSVCVILNEEKNLKTFSGCHQILRKAQDDTMGGSNSNSNCFHTPCSSSRSYFGFDTVSPSNRIGRMV